jgi:pyroglutamyl-peptidase
MTSGRVLLLGFEPFEGFPVNSSWEAIRDLDGTTIRGAPVASRRLPVSYARVDAEIDKFLTETAPSIVVAFGLHPGSDIRLERIALNIDHTEPERPDNDGDAPTDRAISPGGSTTLVSRLPLEPILRRLRTDGLPARLSFHAGTYLCNHVFYRLLQTDLPAGFIHVPPLEEPRRKHGWPLDQLKAAVKAILEAILTEPSSS